MKTFNWLTLASLITLVCMVVFGVYLILSTTITLDMVAAFIIMGFASVATAALSLHLR